MDTEVKNALDGGGLADITTIGARTGTPRRIEIAFHQVDGGYYLTGRPGFKRDWVANIVANPEFTLHLKRGLERDLPVRGHLEPDAAERARVLYRILVENWRVEPEKAERDLDRWVGQAPFVRFEPV
jgi:deazaflavin-dependent oxidoreductase (nitroreductase family)